jgi:hypothetical protein
VRAVYRVTQAIPEVGALPGDYLVAEPSDPDCPLVLTRDLPRGSLPVVLDDSRVTMLDLERPASPPSMNQRPPWRARHLRLIG